MATATVSQYPPSLQAAVDAALAAFPDERARILRGAEIVARGEVREPANGKGWLIGLHGWEVNGTCHCPDVEMNGALRCKHWYAKALYRKMHQPKPVVRTLYFYAEYRGIPGTVQVWEDGRIIFQAYEDDTPIACTYAEVVLAGRKDLVDAAWGTPA